MTAAIPIHASSEQVTARPESVTLVDLLDRVLADGVGVHGRLTLSLANIDLIEIDLALLLAATATLGER